MPKILNFVKITHYYSKLFNGVLNLETEGHEQDRVHHTAGPQHRRQLHGASDLLLISFGNLLELAFFNIYSRPYCKPGGSVHGERANFKGLVIGCIEAKFCKQICVGISLECSRRDLRNALLCTFLEAQFFVQNR